MSGAFPDLTTLTAAVGDVFDVEVSPGRVVALQLTAATPAKAQENASAPATRRGFSLSFAGPREQGLPQGTYSFAHRALGTHAIFIVPIGQDERRVIYEAIFN